MTCTWTALGTALDFPLPFGTVVEALEAAPAGKPFATMWRSEDDIEGVTFGEFRIAVSTWAAYLQAEGLGTGDTIILIMPQGIPLMAAFVATMYLGAVPAILAYPSFKVERVKYCSGLAGVSANLKARLVLFDGGFPNELRKYVTTGSGARLIDQVPGDFQVGARVEPPRLDPDAIAFIQHSAGTTGLQKGVALSHKAVLRQINQLGPALHLTAEDRIYSWLPLYHDMGLIACFILPLLCHLPVVMQSPTDWVRQPVTMLRLMSKYCCTLAWIPNFTLQFLARRVRPDEASDCDLSPVRALINCSEPVRAASMAEFLGVYRECKLAPHVLQSSYAMAETVFAITQSPMDGYSDPVQIWVDKERMRSKQVVELVSEGAAGAVCLVSSGQCLPGNEVRIVSTTGEHLPSGHVGEIVIRSDSMLEGYYNQPDLTRMALRDGWYWSGDLGFVLHGELYVIGRKKDLIIVGGENIYPEDIEEIVSKHPSIHDGRAVAIGMHNPNLGTEQIMVVAEVQKQEDLERACMIERELTSAICGELGVVPAAIYLKPRKWLVKSTAGKPARSATRDKLFDEHPELCANRELV